MSSRAEYEYSAMEDKEEAVSEWKKQKKTFLSSFGRYLKLFYTTYFGDFSVLAKYIITYVSINLILTDSYEFIQCDPVNPKYQAFEVNSQCNPSISVDGLAFTFTIATIFCTCVFFITIVIRRQMLFTNQSGTVALALSLAVIGGQTMACLSIASIGDAKVNFSCGTDTKNKVCGATCESATFVPQSCNATALGKPADSCRFDCAKDGKCEVSIPDALKLLTTVEVFSACYVVYLAFQYQMDCQAANADKVEYNNDIMELDDLTEDLIPEKKVGRWSSKMSRAKNAARYFGDISMILKFLLTVVAMVYMISDVPTEGGEMFNRSIQCSSVNTDVMRLGPPPSFFPLTPTGRKFTIQSDAIRLSCRPRVANTQPIQIFIGANIGLFVVFILTVIVHKRFLFVERHVLVAFLLALSSFVFTFVNVSMGVLIENTTHQQDQKSMYFDCPKNIDTPCTKKNQCRESYFLWQKALSDQVTLTNCTNAFLKFEPDSTTSYNFYDGKTFSIQGTSCAGEDIYPYGSCVQFCKRSIPSEFETSLYTLVLTWVYILYLVLDYSVAASVALKKMKNK